MYCHALLTFFRSLSRHRFYAALNVLGMAAGIAVFLILMLVVRYEYSFNRWIPDAGKIVRLDQTYTSYGSPPFEEATSTFVALDLLRADYPQIDAGARIMPRTEIVSVGQTIDSEDVSYADPNFLDVIAVPLVAGRGSDALSSAASVVISESIARKYFQTVQAVGKRLQISHDGVRRAFVVTAVFRDLPSSSTLPLKLVAPFTPAIEDEVRAFKLWGSSSGETYLRFHTIQDERIVAADLRRFVLRRAAGTGPSKDGPHPENSMAFSLVPMLDAHFHDIDVDAEIPGVDRRIVISLGVVGVLAVLTAAINTVNLATARAGVRAREVALRKVMGATRRMLMLQFLAESLMLVGTAALIGLALAELAAPFVNAFAGWSIRIEYAVVVPLLALLVVIVGLGAGFYPAMLLAAWQPAAVLAAARTPAGGRMGTGLRGLLVLLQFTSATAFAICTLVIDAQASFLRHADRGFDRQGLIIVGSMAAKELEPRQDVILDALRRVPGAVSATLSDREPNSDEIHDVRVKRPGMTGPAPSLIFETVGRDYFDTYRAHLLAGRLFDDLHANDDVAGKSTHGKTFNAILNRAAVGVLGYPGPSGALGQTLAVPSQTGRMNLTIIGVADNVRFASPREPVAPQFYLYDSHSIPGANAAIRFSGFPERVMTQRLQSAWHGIAPENPFVAKTVDERLADFYRPDQQRAHLFSAGAVLAVAIACVGLYGLASFNTARRVKEIGIRKVLGASKGNVLVLLIGQFVCPVLLANLIAWPIAWMAMRSWLAGFDQRIALSPGYFIVATAAAIAISVLTVAGQAWRVARAEPARALRDE